MTISRIGLLVSTNQLKEKLGQIMWKTKLGKEIRVLDTSYDYDEQNDGYKDFYLNGHLPSSLYFNPRQCSESTPQIPFNLPDTNCFTDYIQSLGVSTDTHVIAYDRMDMRAALRAWWMFRLYGHDKISILDGGLKKWVRDGYPTTTEEPQVERGDFQARVNQSLMRDYDGMKATVQSNTGEQIVDARGSGGFNKVVKTDSGELKAHIPGSLNLPYPELLNEDGTFKSVDDLKDVFKKANVNLNNPIVAMCFRGIIGCGVVAAAELVGKHNTPLYYGSYKEWSMKMTE